jgi:ABC-2 type transport system permease protein
MVVFWTESKRGLGDLFYAMSHLLERPDRIYQGITRKLLLFILPFAVMTSLPSQVFFGKAGVTSILHCLLATVIFFCLLLYVWKRGLKVYASASS